MARHYGWAEAGSAMSYVTGHILPDYRGGLNVVHNFGNSLTAESTGLFAASNTDGVFISRFGNDFLVYQQTRFGYSFGPKLLRAQVYWNMNATVDTQRQGWGVYSLIWRSSPQLPGWLLVPKCHISACSRTT
jgi:hypothetical protein